MNRKHLICIALLVIFMVTSLMPIMSVFAATNETITLNSSLYKAIKAELERQGISVQYNDAQYTMTLSDDAINSITELNLSNKSISDITGIDKFKNVTTLDLSANELSKESNLEVLNAFSLKFLDISSNQISDVSAITGIKEIETVNLHNQKITESVVISNEIVKEGKTTVDCELPQIVRDFAKPIKSEWMNNTYASYEGQAPKFDWSSFTSNSDTVKLKIGKVSDSSLQTYNGLATLKIKINDVNNELYNSEITLNYVVVDEDQRGIIIKDKNLYTALKTQLTKGQSINSTIKEYTDKNNLYAQAFDEQMIFIIDINVLVNQIKGLNLDNKRIKDLSGIEMFVGLKGLKEEKGLDISSNYINTIDRIVDLQKTKDLEEEKLQAKFKELAGQLKEKTEKYEKLMTEQDTVVKAYNEAVGKYNSYQESTDQNKTEKMLEQLKIITKNAKRYIQLTGETVIIFEGEYNKNNISDIDSIQSVVDSKIDKIVKVENGLGGEIGNAYGTVTSKFVDIYSLYNDTYKVTSVISAELKYITDEEFSNLTLENAKTLLQTQVNKLVNIEKYLTYSEEQYLAKYFGVVFGNENDQTPVKSAFEEKLKTLEESKNIKEYKDLLYDLRVFDAFVTCSSRCLICNLTDGKYTCRAELEEIELRKDDGESTKFLEEGLEAHNNLVTTMEEKYIDSEGEEKTNQFSMTGCPYKSTVFINNKNILAMSQRIANATDEEIKAFVVLPRLRKLNINENLIENIDEIPVLKELRYLDAGQNEIVNINNVDWSAFEKLKELNLSFNNISEIKALEVLSNLTTLDLSKNLISGSLDFMIVGMKNLSDLNLSYNQIDDIENLLSQYEFIAKDNGKDVAEFFKSDVAPNLNLKSQSLSMEVAVEKTNEKLKLQLPKIFAQAEKIDWDNVSFGIESLYGNVTADGEEVLLNVNKLGKQSANVTITGGIAGYTTCAIIYDVVAEFDKSIPEVEFNSNGGEVTLVDGKAQIATTVNVTDNESVVSAEYAWTQNNVNKPTNYATLENFTNQKIALDVTEEGTWYLWIKASDARENTVEACSEAFVVKVEETKDNEDINININVNEGSSIKEVKRLQEVNYLIVEETATVSDVLKNITIDNENYELVVKDAELKDAMDKNDTVKTSATVVVDGLEDKAKCIIVIPGDVTCDGDIDMSDILKANQFRNEKVDLTDAEFLAGNMEDSDDIIDMSDILKINQYRNNK